LFEKNIRNSVLQTLRTADYSARETTGGDFNVGVFARVTAGDRKHKYNYHTYCETLGNLPVQMIKRFTVSRC